MGPSERRMGKKVKPQKITLPPMESTYGKHLDRCAQLSARIAQRFPYVPRLDVSIPPNTRPSTAIGTGLSSQRSSNASMHQSNVYLPCQGTSYRPSTGLYGIPRSASIASSTRRGLLSASRSSLQRGEDEYSKSIDSAEWDTSTGNFRGRQKITSDILCSYLSSKGVGDPRVNGDNKIDDFSRMTTNWYAMDEDNIEELTWDLSPLWCNYGEVRPATVPGLPSQYNGYADDETSDEERDYRPKTDSRYRRMGSKRSQRKIVRISESDGI